MMHHVLAMGSFVPKADVTCNHGMLAYVEHDIAPRVLIDINYLINM